MGNEASKPPATAPKPSERQHELLASVPSGDDATPKRNDTSTKDSISPMIMSRALLLQHLTTWIQCVNEISKRETAERIEEQWQAEYRAFVAPGVQSHHLHPDGLALLAALYFPFNASSDTEHGRLKNSPVFSNVQNGNITRAQAQWNLSAAGWINSERNGKQKSQDNRKWESNQQKEFQKWIDPTKDSSLDADQIAFLQAISFPLSGSGVSGRTDKKRPATKGSTGSITSKRAKKASGSSRARPKASSTASLKSVGPPSSSWSRTLAMDTDKDNLSERTCFVREQLELFCLSQEGVDYIREINMQKYNNKNAGSCLVAGQVGLRCKHCQQKTAFPSNLSLACATEMNFVGTHLLNRCKGLDDESHKKLLELKRSLGGHGCFKKKGPYTAPEYTAKCLQDIGIEEFSDRKGIFLSHEAGDK